MSSVHFILLVFALVCFLLTAFSASTGRVNTLGLGLAFWVSTLLIPR